MTMMKWQYKFKMVDSPDLAWLAAGHLERGDAYQVLREIGAIGHDGWELVSAIPYTYEVKTPGIILIFKRPV